MNSRKVKDNVFKCFIMAFSRNNSIYISIYFRIYIIKGFRKINLTFLTADYSASGNGGILPMIVSTLYSVVLSIVVATPIGVLAAVYLQEYAKQGKLVKVIRFATESLSGIPSIVYGLFGSIFFVDVLGFGYSILAGSLTVSIIILPVIIRTTEEALKSVPKSYREASLGLGATKFQTLYKVIVPSSLPGVLSGVILSIGRVVGESAAILLTSGTVAKMATSIMSSSRTLTVHAYLVTKESGDIEQAAAVGIVLIVIILLLNTVAKLITKKFSKANY